MLIDHFCPVARYVSSPPKYLRKVASRWGSCSLATKLSPSRLAHGARGALSSCRSTRLDARLYRARGYFRLDLQIGCRFRLARSRWMPTTGRLQSTYNLRRLIMSRYVKSSPRARQEYRSFKQTSSSNLPQLTSASFNVHKKRKDPYPTNPRLPSQALS